MNAQVKLGGSVTLDLGKSFGVAPRDSDKTTIGTPVAPPKQPSPIPGAQGPPPNQPITPQERIAFAALEAKFKEFEEWQRKPGKIVNTYSLIGSAIGLVGFFGGVTGGITMILGGFLGRYLGQKKADQIRDDVSYRDQFLVDYACPRCQHSFQTQPWVTIRQCNKCRINFK
jgi:ribosomal protein L37AE/L43A